MDYCVGLDGYALTYRGPEGYFEIANNSDLLLDHNLSPSYSADAMFGYGLYKLEFYYQQGNDYVLINSPIIIDYSDLNYSYGGYNNMCTDVVIKIYDIEGTDAIKYLWFADCSTATEISFQNTNLPNDEKNKLKCYKQYKQFISGQGWTISQVTPNSSIAGLSKSDELLYPIDGTEIIDPDYRIDQHPNPGLLVSNLKIQYNHQPKLVCGKTFEISKNCTFLLQKNPSTNNGASFTVGDQENNPYCNASLINLPYGTIKLESYTNIYVKKGSKLILKPISYTHISLNSQITLLDGSYFCNYGAIQFGGPITLLGKVLRCNNPYPASPFFQDSSLVILDTNSTLELDDSTTWQFEGPETALICKEGSTIKFGKGSKLVFTDGARINAKHTKFTTYDSNTRWNGIYLSGVSYDTLQNCTIENALNGINIEDKISYFGNAPATQISSCEFSNKTSEQLLNMVYVNNSANVMMQNCISISLINDGFASGVIIEYCTAGGINVIDNEISNVTTGINVIQSSPYIARNTISGAGSSGTGIYLDNSNGTIEYNIVDNFEKSIKLYYSSPYVLKNTFSDANTVCADVTAYSVPVMKPVASGSTLRWLGGNNYFTGQPSTAAITLESEGHPLMDSGYNVINVGNSLYMQGTISRVLYMRVNNWFDDPPESGKFDISGEEYDYSEYFDGYTIPAIDYYELNSIGFGYYDTVYVDEIGGDNPTAEDVFILAYRKEMERKFIEAVVLYKNVIINFTSSNYTITSLSRIFNCLEKSNAGINQYSGVKSYYDGIKNSNSYPQRMREHAEDLAIKAKVRMGFIEEAISDYQTIININGNNPKGIHAQVNKLVLLNMNNGGDNMLLGNRQTSENYKANLVSLIIGKNIQSQNRFASNVPMQFKLYQNYPNPFNPKTNIKYEIPKDAHVTLTIYDITGRQIRQLTEFKQAGSYSYTFDGKNYASGLYIYRIVTPDFTESKKMLLVK